MKTSIIVVSCAKDFRYLRYCLRSIDKFAEGFLNTVLLIPENHLNQLYVETDAQHFKRALQLITFKEWPNKGMNHHQLLEMMAPKFCPLAEAILHFDSDMVFTEPVTPQDFIEDGKPVLVHAAFDWLIKQQDNLAYWKRAVEKALGILCEREMMRRPGIMHIPETYIKAKQLIEAHTKTDLSTYVNSCENSFPQGFAEYPTLGWVAWLHCKDKYKWIDQETEPMPKSKIRQMWSHREPTEEDKEQFKQLGLL